MRDAVNKLPFIGYHVETLADRRKICITNPGGKQFFGVVQPNDFMVWIYDEAQSDRWRITHGEIYEDIEAKLAADSATASALVETLREVCNGAEPSGLINRGALASFSQLPGFPAELILKTYKWIWVQEDCNYPSGEGRWMSMNAILDLRRRMT